MVARGTPGPPATRPDKALAGQEMPTEPCPERDYGESGQAGPEEGRIVVAMVAGYDYRGG
ncbi:hypothetical protein GCM10027089_59760 [Nocardia thraciensis]